MDKSPAPPLLPIFRSQQQAELLALLLGDPDLELSIADLANRLDVPYPSVHREIERAEQAGLIISRRLGNLRLVRANRSSPYFDGLSDVLVRAFGVPAVLARALERVEGIWQAYVFGSWADRYVGGEGQRPVDDIDLLVLGDPDPDALYGALDAVELRLGRPVQVTIRPRDWIEQGQGAFHDTVIGRSLIRVGVDEGQPSKR